MGMFGERYKESKTTNTGGYLDIGKAGGDVEFYKPPKKGGGAIDIIPYIIKTKNHPLVSKGKVKIGQPDYNLDVWVHKNVGPVGLDCVCLKLNYNQPCPICEHADELKTKNGREDEGFKALRAKRRVSYNVLDATKDESKPMVYEVSHFLFEKELIDKAEYEGAKKGLSFVDFADPDEGFTIEFRTSSEKWAGGDKIEFKDFSFVERDFKITKKMMEKAVSLDELLVVRSYKELQDILYGVVDEEEVVPKRNKFAVEDDEEDAPPVRKRRTVEEDEDEDEAPPVRKRRVVEEDEDEAPPVRKPRKVEPEDEDEEKPTAKKGDRCPFGHTFGDDNDKHPECDECTIWEKCRTASKKK